MLWPCCTLSPPHSRRGQRSPGVRSLLEVGGQGEQGMRPAGQWDKGDREAGAVDCGCQEGLCFPRGTPALTLGPWARQAGHHGVHRSKRTHQPLPAGLPPNGDSQPWAEVTRGPAAARPCTDQLQVWFLGRASPTPGRFPTGTPQDTCGHTVVTISQDKHLHQGHACTDRGGGRTLDTTPLRASWGRASQES